VNWHARFVQQAGWTRPLREYLFEQVGLAGADRILEVGCGTGALLSELPAPTQAALHGLDLAPAHLAQAAVHAPAVHLTCGDAQALPYPNESFQVTFCHFLLLWVRDPLRALSEMRRVTHHGGSVLALAEPDYGGRLDRPKELAILGRGQAESLRAQGADPGLGRRLGELFSQAGIQIVESGSLPERSPDRLTPEGWELEWAVLEADLAGRVSRGELKRLKTLDRKAWENGQRRLYVPTYFAWGRV
jgi:SAM-dependent methyltransferase